MNTMQRAAACTLMVSTLALGGSSVASQRLFAKQMPKVGLYDMKQVKDSVVCLLKESVEKDLDMIINSPKISDSTKQRYSIYWEIMQKNWVEKTENTPKYGEMVFVTINFNQNKRDYYGQCGKGESAIDDRKAIEGIVRRSPTYEDVMGK